MLRDRWLLGRKAGSFTIQWHLTNACERSCLHCYDRSPRKTLPLPAARRVLDDFGVFCGKHRVRGQVCLTGGNPFAYPAFTELYRAATVAGYPISILGNPVPRARLAEIAAIRRPVYFQVSLEGLRGYDDHVRGAGHFDGVMEFLESLRALGIRAHVMLTLHKANLDQVIPLAHDLRDRADRFTFNRLTQVEGGALLEQPTREDYARFVRDYIVASRSNPILGFKDSLFNIARHHFGRPLMGGCTGFGCGAAFNFVAILPDGEVHACRKFPSPIGDVSSETLDEIYRSRTARRYRLGSRACRGCPVRNSCGGCLGVVHGCGGRIFEDRDPHCFMDERATALGGL
jgi:selenobiotic family peptide radical SAM maturase